MMIIFHFTYDLNHFGFVEVDFYRDSFWIHFRTLIVALFLGLVGFSLQVATGERLNPPRYLRRLAMLVGAAALVSLGTYLLFGDKMIVFGVLHFIALASVLGLLFRHLFWSNLLLGTGVIIVGMHIQHEWFNAPAWHWIGLMTQKPVTLDYVPLIPWFGFVLIGMFSARIVQKYRLLVSDPKRKQHPLTKILAFSGRHSLVIYLLHQPLLFGGLFLVARG